MQSVAPGPPTSPNLALLPCLLAYARGLGLERHLSRPKRGIPTLALAVVCLVLAWRGTGRTERLDLLDEPLLAALLGRGRDARRRAMCPGQRAATPACPWPASAGPSLRGRPR